MPDGTTYQFVVKRGFRDGKKRELVLSPNELRFQNGGASDNGFITWNASEIESYRFGTQYIRFELAIGREYQIFVRNTSGKVIKISFKSYLGHKKERLFQQYRAVLNGLWYNFFSDKVSELLADFESGKTVKIGDVEISDRGISFSKSGILKQARVSVQWENLGTSAFYTYFSVFDKTDAANVNRGYSYLEDWNTNVLHSVLRSILELKGLENYPR